MLKEKNKFSKKHIQLVFYWTLSADYHQNSVWNPFFLHSHCYNYFCFITFCFHLLKVCLALRHCIVKLATPNLNRSINTLYGMSINPVEYQTLITLKHMQHTATMIQQLGQQCDPTHKTGTSLIKSTQYTKQQASNFLLEHHKHHKYAHK